MKKRCSHMLLALSLLLLLFVTGCGTGTAGTTGTTDTTDTADTMDTMDQVFEDVSGGTWYYDAVQYIYENELEDGMSSGTFESDTALTRAMFVTILGRMEGIDEDDYSGSAGFTDVPSGQWYSPYVKWAAENEIVDGTGDEKFEPDSAITREEMATFLVRYVENGGLYLPNSSKAVASFTDAASVSDWAKESVEQARAWGIFVGDANGEFMPQSSITLAQAATVFMRLSEYLYLSSSDADSLMDTDEEHIATDEDTGIQYVDTPVDASIITYLPGI